MFETDSSYDKQQNLTASHVDAYAINNNASGAPSGTTWEQSRDHTCSVYPTFNDTFGPTCGT